MDLVYDKGPPVLQNPSSSTIYYPKLLPTFDQVKQMQADVQTTKYHFLIYISTSSESTIYWKNDLEFSLSSIYSRVENLECLHLYSSPLGNRSDVIVVSSDNLVTDDNLLHGEFQGEYSQGEYGSIYSSYIQGWMCESSNTFHCKRLASGGHG